MNEARLYTKIVGDNNGILKFYYYGSADNDTNNLNQYIKLIQESAIEKYLKDFSNKNEILYHINIIEYRRLLDHYRELTKLYKNDCSNIFSDINDLKNKILFDIKLKREFESWFKDNGYEIHSDN